MAEGHSPDADADYGPGFLERAALGYEFCEGPGVPVPERWPLSPMSWKPKDQLRNLERAGALYLAALEATPPINYVPGELRIPPRLARCAERCARKIDALLAAKSEADKAA